jgi:hypothetical protein
VSTIQRHVARCWNNCGRFLFVCDCKEYDRDHASDNPEDICIPCQQDMDAEWWDGQLPDDYEEDE